MLKGDVLRKQIEIEPSDFILKTFDGINLFAQCLVPYYNPKALVILIHSIGEHCNRYQWLAEQLVEKDFAVLFFDLRNHGRSGGKKRFAANYPDFLKDIESIVNQGIQMFPSIPVFIYGQGFGGNLALNYTISGSPFIQGLIVTSPWLKPIKKNPAYQSLLIPYLMQIAPGFLIQTGLKAEDISRDLKAVYLYRNDPMISRKMGIKLLNQTNAAAIKASRSIYKINVPFLLMHGSADNFISCQTSRDFVQNASERTTFIEWEGAYHELHNDIEKEKILEAIINWLNIQC
jgi:acylglycerol lipase